LGFSPALEQLFIYPTQNATPHRTPSLITNPPQMIPKTCYRFEQWMRGELCTGTFRLRDLNSRNTDGKSLEGGGEVGRRRREERRFGRIHVFLQGTAENCASITLIGDPFELDLPTHIEVWLFPDSPGQNWPNWAIQCFPFGSLQISSKISKIF
jgi:hypothetical protein